MELKDFGPLVLRMLLGALFLVPVLMKIFVFTPAGVAQMLAGLGFPFATAFAYLLIATELLGGLALILGAYVRWAVWPLVVVMLVATVKVILPAAFADAAKWGDVLFHLLATGALVSLFLTGPGALAAKD